MILASSFSPLIHERISGASCIIYGFGKIIKKIMMTRGNASYFYDFESCCM
jgi:hypothetical protein